MIKMNRELYFQIFKFTALFNLLFIILWIIPGSANAKPDFITFEINTGEAFSQTVLTTHLMDSADIITVNVSKTFTRSLSLYELKEGIYHSEPVITIPLEEGIISVDTGFLLEQEILVLFTSNAAIRFNPRTGEKNTLIEFDSIYNTPIRGSIPKLDLFKDLNGDGLDDFYITSFTGMSLFIQLPDGSFSQPILMDTAPRMSTFTNGVTYNVPQSYFADFNLDRILDIGFLIDGQFSFYSGTEDGSFEFEKYIFTSEVPFQFDNFDELSADIGEDQSSVQGRVLYQLADLDNDMITDLVIDFTDGENLFSKNTTYEIYKGIDTDSGQLTFSNTPVSQISAKGISFDLTKMDFNHDGQIDYMMSTAKIGLRKIIKALFTGSVDIDLNFYQMTNGAYPEKPNVNREVKIEFSLSSGEVLFPSVLVEDLDNDGYSDLIVQKGSNMLQIYSGIDSVELFSKEATDYNVEIPNDLNLDSADKINFIQLNNDDKLDIYMPLPSKSEANRIVFLLSI